MFIVGANAGMRPHTTAPRDALNVPLINVCTLTVTGHQNKIMMGEWECEHTVKCIFMIACCSSLDESEIIIMQRADSTHFKVTFVFASQSLSVINTSNFHTSLTDYNCYKNFRNSPRCLHRFT